MNLHITPLTDPWRDNLDGYHDPRVDIERSIAARSREIPVARPASPRQAQRLVDVALGPHVHTQPMQISADLRGSLTTAEGRIDLLMLSINDELLIPANLYIPACHDHLDHATLPDQEEQQDRQSQEDQKAQKGSPALVLIPGHYSHGKAHDDYQRAARAFASAGFVVCTFDAYGLGERHSYTDKEGIAPGTTEHTYAGLPYWWHGLTTARAFVDEAQAIVRYVAARREVDASQVFVLGSSGGATIACYLAATDPTIAGVIAATFITSRKEYLSTGGRQDAEQILFGDGTSMIEHETLLRAIAPRPVCVAAACSDFFPLEGTRRTCHEAASAWESAPRNLDLFEYDCAHRLAPAMVDHALDFLHRTAATPPRATSASEVSPLPPEHLQVSGTGQVRDEGSIFLHDILIRHLASTPSALSTGELASHEERVTQARQWLRERIMAFRERTPLLIRRPPTASGTHLAWRSEPGIWVCGLTRPSLGGETMIADADRMPSSTTAPLAGTQGSADTGRREDTGSDHGCRRIAILDGQTDPASIDADLAMWVRGRGPLSLRLRDAIDPNHQASSYYKHLCDLVWLGDSLAAGQAFDALQAVEHCGAQQVTLVGYGYGAYLARLVACVSPQVTELELHDEYVNPTTTERLWDEGRGSWQGIIPGLARYWPDIIRSQERMERGKV